MFTIEHDFDATVVTVVDEGQKPLQEDIIVNAFAEVVTITQYDARLDQDMQITFSMMQLQDIAAALDLPEGVYRIRPDDPD